MDALSEILKVVQLNGAIFFNARFTAPWGIATPSEAARVKRLGLSGAERVLLYHYMVEGTCLVTLEGLAPQQLTAGDVIIFPHGDAHTMGSSASAPPQQLDAQAILRERPRMLDFGGGGDVTRLICGYLVCDPRLIEPILAALPPLVTVNLRTNAGRWLESSLQHAVAEASSPQPGTEGVLAKLSEVMVVEALRQYAAELSPEHAGWLSGLRDRAVGRCLALMHQQPARAWTVDSLAREIGTSRSVLAERFTHFVGQSPMQYLGRWRMALATNHLRRSSLSVARIAEEVGYETDAAFSRAFRREFGAPPATWRRLHGSPRSTEPE